MVLLSLVGSGSIGLESTRLLRNAAVLSLLAAFLTISTTIAFQICTILLKTKGLRRVGLRSSSNLSDQYDPKYGTSKDIIRIKALRIHPIKSCKPIELEQARLTKTGFQYDRWFALATAGNDDQWQFCSQRTRPQMALVHQELWLPSKRIGGEEHDMNAGSLIIRFPDPNEHGILRKLQTTLETWGEFMDPMVSLSIPLTMSSSEIKRLGVQYRHFTIHGQRTHGLDLSALPAVAAALPKLQQFLGISPSQRLTLLQCTSTTLRRTDTNLAPLAHIGTPSTHSYTDEQPVHLINLPSVHQTATYLPPESRPLDARRFRPNIFITGAPAFSEESWKRIRIAAPGSTSTTSRSATLSVVCRTGRCTMPSVDPDTGVPSHDRPAPGRSKGRLQPTMTLKEHRNVEAGNTSALGFLGMHGVPEDRDLAGEGVVWVCVGDEIEVLARGEHLMGSTKDEY